MTQDRLFSQSVQYVAKLQKGGLMRAALVVAMILTLTGCASTGGRSASPFTARTCPIPDSILGYPVSISATPTVPLDYATRLADAIARRWLVPSRIRREYPGIETVKTRLEAPEPRWADDWFPGPQHTATASVRLSREGIYREFALLQSSGDPLFDQSLERIFTADPAWIVEMPARPPDLRNQDLSLDVKFGHEPIEGYGFIRFAAQQDPVRTVSGSLKVRRPAGVAGNAGRITVKYVVTKSGNVAPESIQVIYTDSPDFVDAVRQGLLAARFRPARSNCREIDLSLVQSFDFGARR